MQLKDDQLKDGLEYDCELKDDLEYDCAVEGWPRV